MQGPGPVGLSSPGAEPGLQPGLELGPGPARPAGPGPGVGPGPGPGKRWKFLLPRPPGALQHHRETANLAQKISCFKINLNKIPAPRVKCVSGCLVVGKFLAWPVSVTPLWGQEGEAIKNHFVIQER